MQLDLILLGLVLLFAILGAFAGAARQLAQLAALFLAYLAARPLGGFLGPRAASALDGPLVLGVVASTLVSFILVFVCARYALTYFLRRLFAFGHPQDRGLDRTLGFVLGGLKVAALTYVVVCALSFVEANVTLAGKRLGLSPKDSVAFALARRYNLFELAQFSAANDLVALARAVQDPSKAKRLERDPAFRALRQDARFQEALRGDALRRALTTGDHRELLRSNVILKLLQDPTAAARLAAAADAAERGEPVTRPAGRP